MNDLKDVKVCIIDYGSGNIRSVQNIFNKIHDKVVVSNEPEAIESATHLVLPGVGSFAAAMEKIRALSSFNVLADNVLKCKKKFLGICVGMQVLADEGHEFRVEKGLGWIPGKIQRMEVGDLFLPHVGWNNFSSRLPDELLKNVSSDMDFYYVHSFHFKPDRNENVIATTDYGGDFASVIRRENIYGVQFHPEKSQKAGIILLRGFLELS